MTFCLQRSMDEARETYERLVEVFPTCGRYWKLYIEQEVTENSHTAFLVGDTTDSRASLREVRIFSMSFQLYYFVLFPLQIRAGKFENVEKVNKLFIKMTDRPDFLFHPNMKGELDCSLNSCLEISTDSSPVLLHQKVGNLYFKRPNLV